MKPNLLLKYCNGFSHVVEMPKIAAVAEPIGGEELTSPPCLATNEHIAALQKRIYLLDEFLTRAGHCLNSYDF